MPGLKNNVILLITDWNCEGYFWVSKAGEMLGENMCNRFHFKKDTLFPKV